MFLINTRILFMSPFLLSYAKGQISLMSGTTTIFKILKEKEKHI